MGSFSIAHWAIVLVIVLLVFGPNKLGQLGKGMGEGIKNFKKGLSDDDDARQAQKQLSGADPAASAKSGTETKAHG